MSKVRRLQPSEIDWERRRITVREVTKNLRARFTPFSKITRDALNRWVTIRESGTADPALLPPTVFHDFGAPLSKGYCLSRLMTLGVRVGVRCTSHQLRHSCATLLRNAGMPIHQVQEVLGHKRLSTTTQCARSCDGSVAADYTRAMLSVETALAPINPAVNLMGERGAPDTAALIAMLDSLRLLDTLNASQLDVLAKVRAGVTAAPA